MKLLKITEPKSRIIAIDLGTSNSLVSYYDNEEIKIVTNKNHPSGLIPSLVAYQSELVLIGRESIGHNPIKSIKRLMGKGINDQIVGSYPINYEVSNEQIIKLNTSKGLITPTEVAADLLIYLKKMTEEFLGENISRAIITVPAHFDEAARKATRDAARIAGLEVVRLLNEPTAAALAYGLESQPGDKILVYDLGGGTFDLSLLLFQEGIIRVLATSGDNQLGGDDFDLVIVEYLIKLIKPKDFSWRDLIEKANVITKYLTENRSWTGIILGQTIQITKGEVEKIWQPLVDKSLSILDNLFLENQINLNEITEIVLAGGATRIPMIAESLEKKLGKKPLNYLDPDKVVAFGAAIQAKSLAEGGTILVDLVPLSLGIELLGDIVEILVAKNTPIPFSVTRIYTNYKENQTGFEIKIIQGEQDKASDCRALAQFKLSNLPKKPAGQVKVEITFRLDRNGLLFVTATELETGQRLEVEVKPSYGLTEEEIAKLIIKK
jgi:molecular chaperone HscA